MKRNQRKKQSVEKPQLLLVDLLAVLHFSLVGNFGGRVFFEREDFFEGDA